MGRRVSLTEDVFSTDLVAPWQMASEYMGVDDIRGYLFGVLMRKGSYDLRVYFRGPHFS